MTDNIHFKIKGAYQYEAIQDGICFQKSWHVLKYQKALELLELAEGDFVLDAACGSGVLSNMIAMQQNITTIGADFSSAAIDFCKHHYQHANLQFTNIDLQTKHFAEKFFTKVVMLEVLEHLTTDMAATILKNLYDSLQPGGKLILSTPNKNSFWPLIEFLLDTLGLTPKMKNEQHVKLYTRTSLKNILEEIGFKICRVETSHFMAPWLSFLGLKTAEQIQMIEQKVKIFPGSLLFAIAEK